MGKKSRTAGHIHVFAYGSNLCQRRMVARVPSARVVGVGRLSGHILRFHKRSTDGSAKATSRAIEQGALASGLYLVPPSLP